MTTGTTCSFAICAARQRRSPPMISNIPSAAGRTISGWRMPKVAMESASSPMDSSLNVLRGWNLPGFSFSMATMRHAVFCRRLGRGADWFRHGPGALNILRAFGFYMRRGVFFVRQVWAVPVAVARASPQLDFPPHGGFWVPPVPRAICFSPAPQPAARNDLPRISLPEQGVSPRAPKPAFSGVCAHDFLLASYRVV